MIGIGIGRIAALTGLKVPTIRFYEQKDLIPRAQRSRGGHRRYGESTLWRLHFICHARELGFSVGDIRQLLTLSEDRAAPCALVDKIARHHLQEVEDDIARLGLIRSELKRMIKSCRGLSIAQCRILESISHQAAPKSKRR